MTADNDLFPRNAYAKSERGQRRGRSLSDFFPWKSINLAAKRMLTTLVAEVATSNPAHVLVVGSGNQRAWLDELFRNHPHVVICYSDVDDKASVDLYCDGHYLPFQDGVFQGVIASAVLEHVLYPERVIGEIHRVLSNGGVVYSEIPFMQQVHEGAYDFTRYSLSGHRRVFHDFEELSSGIVAGPGTTLLWALEHFFSSFAPGHALAGLTRFAIRTLFFWVKYFDYALASTAAAVDGASCTYFLGRKTPGSHISDREIIDGYAGRKRLRHV
jgi:SAM-dependent methyltransferase